MSIISFKNQVFNQTYLAVSLLGNSFKLNIKYTNSPSVELNKKENEIDLFLPKKYKKIDNTSIINLSIQKLYDQIAENEIEYAMEVARHILKYAPDDYSIKRLNNKFYNCLKNSLVINPDIVKYNRDIINTTIIQAFCKIKYKSNSLGYKKLLSNSISEYEYYKNNKRIKKVS